jgi:hypothetical protein
MRSLAIALLLLAAACAAPPPPPLAETRVALAAPLPPADLGCGVYVPTPGGGPGWARLCASPERGEAAAAALSAAASRRGGFQLARQTEPSCGIVAALNIKKPGSAGPLRLGNSNGPLLRVLEPGVAPNRAFCTGGTPLQITHSLNVGEETFFLSHTMDIYHWNGRGDVVALVPRPSGPVTGSR